MERTASTQKIRFSQKEPKEGKFVETMTNRKVEQVCRRRLVSGHAATTVLWYDNGGDMEHYIIRKTNRYGFRRQNNVAQENEKKGTTSNETDDCRETRTAGNDDDDDDTAAPVLLLPRRRYR